MNNFTYTDEFNKLVKEKMNAMTDAHLFAAHLDAQLTQAVREEVKLIVNEFRTIAKKAIKEQVALELPKRFADPKFSAEIVDRIMEGDW